MLRHVFAGATFGALILAGCGGGGGGGTTPGYGNSSTGGGAVSAPASAPQEVSVGGSMAFVGQNGYTLYVFSGDAANTSNCNGACSGVWPPYTAPAGTSAANTSFSLITRSNGSLQWTYKGAPMYNYSGDTGAAQSNGQGITSFGGTWSVSRPTSTSSGGGGSGYIMHRQ